MATVWRIVSPAYASEALSGAGAARHPGRWNRAGDPMIYTAATQSLAMLERLVYMISPFPEMTLAGIELPNSAIQYLDLDQEAVTRLFTNPRQSRAIGAGWIRSQPSLALAVPSIHIHPNHWKAEPNILLNPTHPAFKKVSLKSTTPFTYNTRLEK